MNPKLQEINELIALCDQMLNYVWENGFISTRNETYITYTRLWERFSKKNDVISKQVIKQMFFSRIRLIWGIFLTNEHDPHVCADFIIAKSLRCIIISKRYS